jgi:hypothetical protein
MPLGSFGNIPAAEMTHAELLEDYARFKKEVKYLLNGGIDTLNVLELNAEVINAGILNAGLVTVRADYEGGAFIEISANGIRINDGTKDTFTANTQGHVTMTEALVRSSENFPKVELNGADNIFAAYAAIDQFIKIITDYLGSTPTIYHKNGTYEGVSYISNNKYMFATAVGTSTDIDVSSGRDLYLSANTGSVKVASWSKLYSINDTQSLKQELDNIKNRLSALESSSGGGV